MKISIILVVVLIGALVGNVAFWNLYYTNKIQASYDSGFLEGKEAEHPLAYDAGYQLGYIEGNISGFEFGYSFGFYSGNATGYEAGYNNGYMEGYAGGFVDGNETGFYDGYLQGVKDGAGTGYNMRDPTYPEALDFIVSDETDKNEYSENYTCFNFAADFKTNAFHVGYKCGFVYLEFQDYAHAIVCFNTTDQNIIFIEPQTDEIVTIAVGELYDGDLIVYYAIVW